MLDRQMDFLFFITEIILCSFTGVISIAYEVACDLNERR